MDHQDLEDNVAKELSSCGENLRNHIEQEIFCKDFIFVIYKLKHNLIVQILNADGYTYVYLAIFNTTKISISMPDIIVLVNFR